MKKIITILLVGLMLLGGTISANAEEPGDALMERLAAGRLKEFTEEIHQINDLRIERNQLRIQVIEKQDQLVDLILDAKEAGNKEALEAAKAERAQIKAINNEIKVLHEQAATTRKAYREAAKSKDLETARTEIEKLINIHNSINDKKEDKIEVLNKVIDILS